MILGTIIFVMFVGAAIAGGVIGWRGARGGGAAGGVEGSGTGS